MNSILQQLNNNPPRIFQEQLFHLQHLKLMNFSLNFLRATTSILRILSFYFLLENPACFVTEDCPKFITTGCVVSFAAFQETWHRRSWTKQPIRVCPKVWHVLPTNISQKNHFKQSKVKRLLRRFIPKHEFPSLPKKFYTGEAEKEHQRNQTVRDTKFSSSRTHQTNAFHPRAFQGSFLLLWACFEQECENVKPQKFIQEYPTRRVRTKAHFEA